MTKQIKPPKGWRLLKDGEIIKIDDLCFFKKERWVPDLLHGFPQTGKQWNKMLIPFARCNTKPKTAPISAEQAWRWLAANPSVVLVNYGGKWNVDDYTQQTAGLEIEDTIATGKSPLAAVRAAMAVEKGGK